MKEVLKYGALGFIGYVVGQWLASQKSVMDAAGSTLTTKEGKSYLPAVTTAFAVGVGHHVLKGPLKIA